MTLRTAFLPVTLAAALAAALPSLKAGVDATYIGPVSPGDWHTPAHWSGGVVPSDTAAWKYTVTYNSGGEVGISAPVTVTDLTFTGASRLLGTASGSLTVTRRLSMGGEFRDMGTVNAGTPEEGGITIDSASVFLPQSNWLSLVNTTLVNRGPEGSLRGEETVYFFNGAKLVNEGTFGFPLAAYFSVADGDPGNAVVNRGTLTFDAPSGHVFRVNTRTEGGLWDVRRGSLSFEPVFNGVNGFHPGSVSHVHEDATFRLAADSALRLTDNTTTGIAGNSFIEGDGELVVIGGELRVEGDNLAAENIVLERGALSSTANAHLRAGNLELRSGLIAFPGELSASTGFQFRNRQDFFSGNGLTLRGTQLDLPGPANEWAKTDGGSLTFGHLARLHVWPGARFKITGSMGTAVEPGAETTALFINEGDIEVTGAGALICAPYFDHRGGTLRCFSGAGNLAFARGLGLAAPIHLDGQTVTLSGLVEPHKPGGHFAGTGQVDFHGATLRLEPAADFALPNAEFLPVAVEAPMSGRIRCGDLTLRNGGSIGGTRIEAAGALKILTHPLGGNYTLELREGTSVVTSGTGGLIRDWGLAGQRSYLVFGEGSSLQVAGGLNFGNNIMALDPVAASQDGPPFVPANTGRFENSGSVTVPTDGLVTVHRDVGFGNSGVLTVAGTLVLGGRLANGGDLIVSGATAGLSAGEISAGDKPGSIVVDQGATVSVLGPLTAAGILGKGSSGISTSGAGGGIVAVGAGPGIVTPGAGSGIVTPGAGSGIVAVGAGTVISSGGGGNIVGAGAGSPIVAAGAGQIVGNNGTAIIAQGPGSGIGATGAGSRVQSNGSAIMATGAGTIIASGAGGGIVASGAGGGIVASGAGGGIVASGAGSGLREGRGPAGSSLSGTVQATGDGSHLVVEDGGLIEGSVKIFAGTASVVAGSGTLRAPLIHDCGALSPGSAGILGPAEPLATLTLNGDLRLEATSSLVVEIAASRHDLAQVTGNVTLAGRLAVHLRDGFTPAGAQTFQILTGSTLTGTFDNLSAGRVATADNKGTFAVSIGPGAVTLGDYQPGRPAGSMPFTAWRTDSGYFSAAEASNDAVSGPDADPDGDGINNRLEYALGLHPRHESRAALPSLVRRPDGALVLTWTRASNIVGTVWPESTPNPTVGWTPLVSAPWLVDETAALQTWSAILPMDAPGRLARLKFVP